MKSVDRGLALSAIAATRLVAQAESRERIGINMTAKKSESSFSQAAIVRLWESYGYKFAGNGFLPRFDESSDDPGAYTFCPNCGDDDVSYALWERDDSLKAIEHCYNCGFRWHVE